jgi:predicted DNA-binding transcriptional regulator AlpA
MKTPVRVAPAPLLIDLLSIAALADCSRRKARDVVKEPWFPPPVRLGPRVVRWPRDQVIEALTGRAGAVPAPSEPEPLRRSRGQNAASDAKRAGE